VQIVTHDPLRYSYDGLGRAFKTEVLKDDGTTVTRTEQATFDALGRAANVTNNLGSFTSTYAAGNLSAVPDSVARPGGYSSTYTRHPLSAATPANAALNQGNALRLANITHKDAANTILQNHGYQYSLDGDITAWTQNTRRRDLQYNALGELTTQSSTLLATNALEDKRTWAYDAAGNMLSRGTERGSTKTMELRQHSGRNQLSTIGGGGRTLMDGTVNEPASVTVQVGSTAAAQPARVTSQSPSGPYRFQREADFPVGSTNLTITAKDGNNNTRTQTFTVSVTDAETRSLGYDSNGNLKTKTYLRSGTSYRVETYTWDAENRLTGWQDKTLATQTAPEIITASTTWQYDGQGRRVKEHNVQGTTTTDKNILWSSLEMIQWQNPDGSVARNLFATGEQQPTSSLQPQASSLIYLPDHLGSIRGWYNPVDNTKGSADYSAYGTRTITANTASFTPARSFTGHYQHEASGLVLAPYRAYDAELGRWISEDPIGEEGGVNLYGYVGGRIVLMHDPAGLETFALRLNFSAVFFDMTFAIVADQNNNIEFQITPAVGFTPRVSLTAGVTVTDACDVKQLHGAGTSKGISAEANYVDGDGYGGVDFGYGIGAGLLPASPQIFYGNTDGYTIWAP
jgi:RHS repeat-associated protein